MRVRIISIPVTNQEEALKFYVDVLRFKKKKDIPLDEKNRWLTLVSEEDENGVEILLEPSPNHFEPAATYQKELMKAGIPYTQFEVSDIRAEFERLTNAGAVFTMTPTDVGGAIIAIFKDTCGNLLQLVEEK